MKKVFLSVLALMTLLASCRAPTSTPPPRIQPTARATSTMLAERVDISSIEANNYPRVDGSTSALPLQITLACTILNVHCTWMYQPFQKRGV